MKKVIIAILVAIILVLGFLLFTQKKTNVNYEAWPETEPATVRPTTNNYPVQNNPAPTQTNPTNPINTNQQTNNTSTTSNPCGATSTQLATVENVSDQPAYLIRAYSKNNANCIDVDYIDMSGSVVIQDMMEKGECSTEEECNEDLQFYVNGYKVNKNPLVRTFEVKGGAQITINGSLFGTKVTNALESQSDGSSYYTGGDWYSDYSGNQSNHISTFTEFKNLTSSFNGSFVQYNPPFQKPLTYIRVDIRNNVVTKIDEPYQS